MQSIPLRSVSLFFMLAAAPLSAADVPARPLQPDPLDHGTFSFYFENDLFGGTDQRYTNGRAPELDLA